MDADVLNELKEQVLDRIDLTKDMDDGEIQTIIDSIIIEKCKEKFLSLNQREIISKNLFNAIRRLDIIQELIEDPTITEIMINGPQCIFIEKNGYITKWNKVFESKEKLEDVIQQIVSKVNRVVNEASPIVDARLQDGSRINVVLPPVALNGPILTIRKFPEKPITMEQLIEWNAITNDAAKFLECLVKAKYNIFICGGTGSGKTTFLNVLSNYIPEDERIITIEDSAELQIKSVENLIKLETRNANIEGKNAITIRDLIKSSLRMRPDRIVVGEVRGAEALDMLQAMNTGHDGSISTGHANSTKDMLTRLETMVLTGAVIPLEAIRQQIASAIDIIVYLGRIRDKSRRVLEIVEVLHYENNEIKINALYKFREIKETPEGKIEGVLERTDKEMVNKQKLQMAGLNMNL
ncbi:pilus assembly protein CpaF [Natranaerovirga pectinivora]|uniref:Pilus assembly protein CpaF n=1 Tax=Natranaerovirga pectinivora TaxID=682400 RepID=A0A4R3MF17_9FIRM|nr:CpaF family protein [Natranaerovirga pectinivora]TCT11653.1 pilus assembly protein CpaF [Natranaerovirga pectinivora]